MKKFLQVAGIVIFGAAASVLLALGYTVASMACGLVVAVILISKK